MDMRKNLRFLGVPLRKKSFMFGCNDTVVDSVMTPHSKTHKRHVALSFHRVRKAIAAKILTCHFIRGMINLTDILSKHRSHAKVWTALKPLLFWKGDAMDCLEDGEKS